MTWSYDGPEGTITVEPSGPSGVLVNVNDSDDPVTLPRHVAAMLGRALLAAYEEQDPGSPE